MKTAAEVFKCDEGFKVFAAKCGHKGDVSQWQDIHIYFWQAMKSF